MYSKNKKNTNLKKLRQEKGFSQERISKLLGIDPTRMSHYENGSNIPLDRLKAMAYVLDVTIDEILEPIDISDTIQRCEDQREKE